MANSQYPKTVSFSTTIPFDQPLSYMAEYTITGAVTFAKNTTGAYPGYGTMIRLVADGSHTPDLSAFAIEGPGSWVNTTGTVNKLFFYYDGSQYCVIITQPGAGGTGGGGGGLTQLSTPGSFTATAVSSSEIDLSWSDVANDSGYKIYFNGVNDFGSASLLTTTAANATSYNHTGLSSSSTFYYWIKAVGDGITYSDSNTASANDTTMAGGGGSFPTTNRVGLWRKADIVDAGGGIVGSWPETTGNGIDWVPAVGEEPSIDTDGTVLGAAGKNLKYTAGMTTTAAYTAYFKVKKTAHASELLGGVSGWYSLYMDGSSTLCRPDPGTSFQTNASVVANMSVYKVLAVVVHSGTTPSELYIDGVLTGTFDTTNIGSTRIFETLMGESAYVFKGNIECWAVFNGAHTGSEVATNSPLLASA